MSPKWTLDELGAPDPTTSTQTSSPDMTASKDSRAPRAGFDVLDSSYARRVYATYPCRRR